MPKGQQRSNREAKKPKKDQTPSKPLSPRPAGPVPSTVVPDRRDKK